MLRVVLWLVLLEGEGGGGGGTAERGGAAADDGDGGLTYDDMQCAAAIRWAGMREYIYGTSVATLLANGNYLSRHWTRATPPLRRRRRRS